MQCFGATWGQLKKYVEQSEMWAALGCVGVMLVIQLCSAYENLEVKQTELCFMVGE